MLSMIEKVIRSEIPKKKNRTHSSNPAATIKVIGISIPDEPVYPYDAS